MMSSIFIKDKNIIVRSLFYISTFICIVNLFNSCKSDKEKKNKQLVEVKNELNFAREEIVAIKKNDISNLFVDGSGDNIRIKKKGAENYLPVQWIDYDQDGDPEELLFQANVEANSTSNYIIVIDSSTAAPKPEIMAYSRFVPERIDDYTWENDKVAFRTYGPTAQRKALEDLPGGTLSSGIDLWFKRTDKPIIDKWYKKNTEEPGYYHKDHGEGYDRYHVGKSRGTGGTGVWENDSLYVSKNFTEYETIAAGPLRTVFQLKYATWSKYEIQETKTVILDLGSNFSKFEIDHSSNGEVPNYAVGITLHENEGEVKINEDDGWFLHMETIDGHKVGEGIIMDPKIVDSAFAYISKTPDQSHLLITIKPSEKLIYYAGFAWERSGQIDTMEDWKNMLKRKVEKLNQPLKVILK